MATTTYGEHYAPERVAARQRAVIEAGRVTAEQWAALGFKGSTGFLGRGTYGTDERAPGYGAERSK